MDAGVGGWYADSSGREERREKSSDGRVVGSSPNVLVVRPCPESRFTTGISIVALFFCMPLQMPSGRTAARRLCWFAWSAALPESLGA